jgi:hypothetical protein
MTHCGTCWISESFTIDSELHPDEVVRRLDVEATEWRESRFSDAARAAGMYGFTFHREGNAFRIRPSIANRGVYAPVYVGVVTSLATGSRISGVFRFTRGAVALPILWLLGVLLLVTVAVVIVAKEGTLLGTVVAVGVAPGVIALFALWVRFLFRHAWRSGQLMRAETRALLSRVATAPRPR